MTRRWPTTAVSRRQLLRRLAVATAVAVPGCVSDPPDTPTGSATANGTVPPGDTGTSARTATPTRFSDYESVVDVADGVDDPTAGDAIAAHIDGHARDDTVLFFPEGRYVVDAVELDGLSNVALVGAADAPVELTPAVSGRDLDGPWFDFRDVENFRFENVDLDFREPGVAAPISLSGAGDFTVRDVTTHGTHDVDGYGFRFAVHAPDRRGLVENVTAVGATEDGLDVTGMYVQPEHAGELVFRDCHLESFSDNGLYASAPGGQDDVADPETAADGVVHVRGGLYKNNNIANVRLGSTGSTARRVTVVVDAVPPRPPSGLNVRGIRLRGKRAQRIEHCTIRYSRAAGSGSGAIELHEDNGRAFIRDTCIEMNRDGMAAVRSFAPTDATARDGPTGPVLDNVTIVGTAGTGEAATFTGRDGTIVRSSCIHQPGTSRDGIVFVDSNRCSVDDTVVSVTGEPITRTDSDVGGAHNTLESMENGARGRGPCAAGCLCDRDSVTPQAEECSRDDRRIHSP